MQRFAPAANASHELIGTAVFNRDVVHASISEIERVSLARFAWFVVAYNVAVIVWAPTCAQLDPEPVAAVTGPSATANSFPRHRKLKQ